ncbi:hypothetical protein PGT21_028352 [Puccinia graminis f. sp. tritici]|uniref:Uncharacterized protein n=1 Tax=Puccinia graminis f. sp. tritici TaxID=56615 RepID=A0A5B0MPZ2_PUCGR|nr:hypothetical protein PGT21_028352 [Puccinia graminis f. sp. tritici]
MFSGLIRGSVGGQKLKPGGQSSPPAARSRVRWRCSQSAAHSLTIVTKRTIHHQQPTHLKMNTNKELSHTPEFNIPLVPEAVSAPGSPNTGTPPTVIIHQNFHTRLAPNEDVQNMQSQDPSTGNLLSKDGLLQHSYQPLTNSSLRWDSQYRPPWPGDL